MRVLALAASMQRTQGLLQLAHQHMGLELAYVAEFTGGRRVTRYLAGDAHRFGLAVGDGPLLQGTNCQRMVDGEIPNIIRDAAIDGRVVVDMHTTEAKVGAYIGVPLLLTDGSVYGALVCVSSKPDPTLDERDVRLMAMLAGVMAEDLTLERDREAQRLVIEELMSSDNVRIACQPIVDLLDGRVMGLEALARFPAPYRPEYTFAAAHILDSRLGLNLELFVIRKALRLLPKLGVGQFLSINLSPAAALELFEKDSGLPSGVPLHRVVLEITEHEVVDNYLELRSALAPFRKRGLQLSIDDAGAGFASLHHIVELRPDFIKVDRSLVNGVSADRARRVTVTSFVLLALELGCTVIAEGVETKCDLDALSAMGVDAAQGYLLGRPSDNPLQLAAWTAPRLPIPGIVAKIA